MTSEERKGLIWLTAVTVMAFSLLLVFWFAIPLQREKAEMSEQAKEALIRSYYNREVTPDQKAEWFEKYGLTDDDINPAKIMQGVSDEAN